MHEYRLLPDQLAQLAEWQLALRQTLPTLLKVAQSVGRFDCLTFASASWSLARLCASDAEHGLAIQTLRNAISRLEEDMDEQSVGGSRAWLDEHPALSMSFDPPALRPVDFAYFRHCSNNYSWVDDGVFEHAPFDEDHCEKLKPPRKARTGEKVIKRGNIPLPLEMDPANRVLREDTMVIPAQKRMFQEKSVILMKLYEELMTISLDAPRQKRNVMLRMPPVLYKSLTQALTPETVLGEAGDAPQEGLGGTGVLLYAGTRELELGKTMTGDAGRPHQKLFETAEQKKYDALTAVQKRQVPEPPDYNPEKLTVSQQEADLVHSFGDNPYLRCLFFCQIAAKRLPSSNLALTKALGEAEKAVALEMAQWQYFEKQMMEDQEQKIATEHNLKKISNHDELLYQDLTIQNERKQTTETRQKSKKTITPSPRQPVFVAKSSRCLFIRIPRPLSAEIYDQAHSRIYPSLRTVASRIHISELRKPNLVKAVDTFSKSVGSHSLAGNVNLDTYIVYGKEAGIVKEVTELHHALENTGGRRPGSDYVAITGLTPNKKYTFAVKELRGFDIHKGLFAPLDRPGGTATTAAGLISHATLCCNKVKLSSCKRCMIHAKFMSQISAHKFPRGKRRRRKFPRTGNRPERCLL